MNKSLLSILTMLLFAWVISAQPEYVGNMIPNNDHTVLSSGNTLTVFTQVYKQGVTEAGGQGANITCQIRVRGTSTLTDGSISGATPVINSFPMTYNVDKGNNDEYMGTITAGSDGRYSYECACSHNGSSFTSSWDYTTRTGQLEYFTVGNYDTYRTMLVVKTTPSNLTYYDIDKFQPGNTNLPATIGGTNSDRICSNEELRLGGETNVFKISGNGQNVFGSRVHYSIDGNPEVSFNLSFRDNCATSPNVVSFSSGGSCVNSDGVLDQRLDNNNVGGVASGDLLTGLSAGEHTVNFHFETDHNGGTETTGSGSFTFFKINLPSGGGCEQALLPVLLDQFSAKKEKETVLLQWQTFSELNNDYFILEHSKDAKNWKEISQIKGKGTTNETANYSYLHKTPQAGINYYRLKQVDYDGAFEYFDVVSVVIGQEQAINVYPNPVTDQAVFEFQTKQQKGTLLSIYSVNGQLMQQRRLEEDVLKAELNLSDLVEGVYFIQIATDKTQVNQRFIKQ